MVENPGQGLNAETQRAQLRTSAKERRLQPAEAPFLPCCRVNAAFLAEAFEC